LRVRRRELRLRMITRRELSVSRPEQVEAPRAEGRKEERGEEDDCINTLHDSRSGVTGDTIGVECMDELKVSWRARTEQPHFVVLLVYRLVKEYVHIYLET